jgi:S1-C subfamily serine protease
MSTQTTVLSDLSDALANVVEQAGPSVVRVDDGTRLTASGILWSEDGIVVATSHGVERDEELAVETADGARHSATLVGRDPDTDIAVLRVAANGYSAIPRAPASEVRIGHLVLALGRPGNSGLQATVGIIGARHETQSGGQEGYVLHTDAVLYPGFSGGALVDTNGRLVGMNNLLYGRGRGVAIGTPIIATVVSALLQHGRIRRGYLGVRTQNVTLHGGSQAGGVLIVQVEPNSPAAGGGLLLGDAILGLDGEAIHEVDDLRHRLRMRTAGQAVNFRILRGGEEKTLTVTLGEEE